MHHETVKQYTNMAGIKFLDVVKWRNPVGALESQDVMVAEDIDGDFLTVRHLSTGKRDTEVATIFARDIKVVGHCTAYEPIADIIKRYINK